MTWGFLWLMLALKIPIAALLWIVWWAIHQDAEPGTSGSDEDGGTKVGADDRPRRGGPRPPRRRGPHGGGPIPAPARVRTTVARPERTVRD